MEHRRKSPAVIAVCFMLLLSLGIGMTAMAKDLSHACALTVAPCGEASGFAEDLAGITIDAYYVAEMHTDANISHISFTPQSDYESMRDAITAIGPETTAEDYAIMSQEAAVLALGRRAPEYTAVAGEAMTEMPAGLYLLVAHGDHDNYVLTDKETGAITTTAYSSEYTYYFAPELVALPMVNEIDHTWNFDATAVLKPEQGPRYGDLEIVKTLKTYETSEPVMFVFSVEAVLGGGIVYSDVVSLTFTEAGVRKALVKNIPVGADVTVTEIYSGSAYTLKSAAVQTAVISAEELQSVSFENDYNGTGIGGHGALNHFDKTEDGWKWSQLTDSTQIPSPAETK